MISGSRERGDDGELTKGDVDEGERADGAGDGEGRTARCGARGGGGAETILSSEVPRRIRPATRKLYTGAIGLELDGAQENEREARSHRVGRRRGKPAIARALRFRGGVEGMSV
jgi:hypothetical protein